MNFMREVKRIGDYILEQGVCTSDEITQALARQGALKEKSTYKPLESILIEDFDVSSEKLLPCLNRMHIDILSSSGAFNNFPKESLSLIISKAKSQTFPEDSIIFQKGDKTDCFFIILSGEVQVYRETEDGRARRLAILKAGESFGEIALLTEGVHTTSVKTMSPVCILAFSKKDFYQLCEDFPEVSRQYIKIFAKRIAKNNEDLINATANELAYQQFVSQQDDLSIPDVIGQTRVVNNLRTKIADVAEDDNPTLITGDNGTEKLVVAAEIHKNSRRSTRPFMFMNAEDVSLNGSNAASNDPFQLEISQKSTLFGHVPGAFPNVESNNLGLLQICKEGTVVIENIDHLCPDVQHDLVNFIQTGEFYQSGSQGLTVSSVRIIGTSTLNLKELEEKELFNTELFNLLAGNPLAVPPLKKRKKDLRLLVDFIIIQECFKSPGRKLIKGMSDEAYKRIMAYDWPGNLEELEVVIRRAIILAQGDYLTPEDIFVGMAPPEGKLTFNLLQLDKVRNVFRNRFYPVGPQVIVGLVFTLIFLSAFTASTAADSNISLVMVWGMWEPLLFLSWFVAARIWCAVCPMGAVHDLLNRFFSLKKKVPKFIRNYGVYISAAGLALIIYAEVASDMHYSPRATGFLLLAILAGAILCGLLFERRVWCRYLCPLGRLGAIFSGCSIIEWRSNASICNSTCTTDACFKGTENVSGCPLYQGPFSLRSNQNCILCGNCVKICEDASPVLNLRIPGHELWAVIKPERVASIFIPVILGTQFLRGLEHTSLTHAVKSVTHSNFTAFAIILLLATAVSFYFVKISGSLSFGQLRNSSIDKGQLFTNALIPLAFAFEIGYQLKPFLERLGHFFPILGRQLGFDLEFLDFAVAAGSAKPWQTLIVLLGMITSLSFLKIIIRNHETRKNDMIKYNPFRYLPLFFLAGLYIGIFNF